VLGHVAGEQVSGFAVAGRFEDEIARKNLCRPELTVRSVDRAFCHGHWPVNLAFVDLKRVVRQVSREFLLGDR